MKILSFIGTRPECIKLGPVIHALQARGVQTTVCLTGQHRDMLNGILPELALQPDLELAAMPPGRSLNETFAAILEGADRILHQVRPDRVLVQGDTTTAMAAGLAAFNQRVPVGHVEAGLRTLDLNRPWPEEVNRRAIDIYCDLLFAPTAGAAENLRLENLPGRIVVTGNTGIDAIQAASRRLGGDGRLRREIDAALPAVRPGRRLILVTGHRRETFGNGLLSVCRALHALSRRNDVDIVYALHLNPQVLGPVRRALGDRTNIQLAPPQSYLPFVRLLQRAHLVITDSGGVQEEAPALGKPVLVTRTETERPEGLLSGAAQLVGTETDVIIAAANRLLDDHAHYARRAIPRLPFGDGRAAERIACVVLGETVEEFREAGWAPTGVTSSVHGELPGEARALSA